MTGETEYSFESDTEYLARLRELIAAGAVRIRFDTSRLKGMDSPVVVIAETERWAMGMVAVTAAVWWFLGHWAALGVFAVSVLAYVLIGRRGIARNIEKRIHNEALNDIGKWRALWRYGGVSLESASAAGMNCNAPDGRWIYFVEQLTRGVDGSGDAQAVVRP
jgi:muconolactone delta-isomerase